MYTEAIALTLYRRLVAACIVRKSKISARAKRLERALGPDAILMYIRMPRLDGLAAVRAIKAELPDVKIVMLTISEADDDLFEAIKSGDSGWATNCATHGQAPYPVRAEEAINRL